MSQPLTLTLQCFGAFRALGETLTVELNTSDSVQALKEQLSRRPDMPDALKALLNKTRLANASRVLSDDERLEADESLALIPPVSGG